MGDKKLLAALAGALAIAMMAIAFLLGRQSAPPPQIVVQAPPQEVRVVAAPPAPPAQPQAPPPDVVLEENDGKVSLVTPPRSGTAPRPATPPEPGPESAGAIASYLAAVDQIRIGPGGDQQGFANQLMAEAAGGNTQGMDQLLKDSKAAEARLRAIAPPPEAAAHHRALLSLMSEGNQTLATLRDALKRQDPNGLASLLSTAQGMQTRAKEVEQLEADLRARAGP